MLFDKVMDEFEDHYKRRLLSVADRTFDEIYSQRFNPFKTDKTTANDVLRLCLKSKPQLKCQGNLPRI